MTRLLLDTTALLVYYLDEPGAEAVHDSLEDSETDILICAVSVAEFARRLVALGESVAGACERSLAYAGLCDEVVPVDTALATRAFELSHESAARVPLVDSFIAAVAQLSESTLLHRDAHFTAIPGVRQVAV